MKEELIRRFTSYVQIDTQSNEDSATCPSTPGQLVLLNKLVDELKEIGMEEVTIDENGYVFATLPANTDKDVPTIGFLAHVDTAPDFTGKNVKPQIIENYDGKDILLNREENIVLSPKEFPSLNLYVGHTLITTDGTTLLGADDKAGVAEIMTAMNYLLRHPEIKHGKVRVAFTPDEEIGRGPHKFDVKNSTPNTPIRWTAAASANCSTKASTRPAPKSRSKETTSTRARRRERWSTP